MLATSFGAGQVAYSILWFFLFVIEIWLMLSVFVDIFRSHDLRGWAKALWVLFVLVIPLVGILAYIIVRGDRMRAHQAAWRAGETNAWARAPQANAHDVVQSLHHLAELRDRGDISADEFRRLRDELLSGHSSP